MEALLAFWQDNGAIILAVLGVVIGLATFVARGEGKELARLVVQLVQGLATAGWQSVTEAQVRDLAGRIYEGARDYAGPPWLRLIPWRLWITKEMVQTWAWLGWCKLRLWYESQLAQTVVIAAKSAGEIPRSAILPTT
jgi:hypothetical protein